MKRILLLLSLVACMQAVQAQYYRTDTATHHGFDKSKLIVGGGLGLAFGDWTNITVQPQIGYRFNRFVAAGVTLNYLYSSDKYYDQNNNQYKDTYRALGGGLWGRVYPIPNLFLQVQPELNSVKYKSNLYSAGDKPLVAQGTYGVPSLLVGGGYGAAIGGRSMISLMILFDVLNRPFSPYGSAPIIAPSFTLGF